MNWNAIGARIRGQREYIGYTREQLAELIDVTPKFCSDIELGVKGMSVPTLCRISKALHLSVDYILFGKENKLTENNPIYLLLENCDDLERRYAEQIIKTFLAAMDSQKELK